MQVILCPSLKISITPRGWGSLQHKHVMLLPVVTLLLQCSSGSQLGLNLKLQLLKKMGFFF